jgi:3-oxoacyl-[acyl-carrier-protein] synthase III
VKIAGIGVAIPSRRVDNADVVQLIAEQRPRDAMSSVVARSAMDLLLSAGSDVRYYRDLERGECARDLLAAAIQRALVQAGITADEIDLLLFCGVGRGFIEPANAYVCANQLGLRCDCFDISDACMGWLRAAQIAHDALAVERYRRVLVVNAEFGIYEMFTDCFRVGSPLELRRTFAAFTLGEAATATVFAPAREPWTFAYRSRPDLAGLCMYPLPGHQSFVAPGSELSRAKPMSFCAYSGELIDAANEELLTLIGEQIADVTEPRLYVPHAASSTSALAQARRLGVPIDRLYNDVMPRYGNVASASLPLGLHCAAAEGRLHDQDDVVLCPASAGVSVAVARFRWQPAGC